MTYSTSLRAIISALCSLFSNRRSSLLMLAVYAGLLGAIYLFVSTREATVSQLVLTLVTVIAAPALFFVLQAVSVSYTSGPASRGLLKHTLKLIVVCIPVIALTLLAVYGLNKIHTHPAVVTTVRYLLLAVISPLLVIQLWISAGNNSPRAVVTNLRKVVVSAFAPQSMFVYVCGFLIFALAPYFLLHKTLTVQRPWLELTLMVVRLSLSALLILLGWVTTVGALANLERASRLKS